MAEIFLAIKTPTGNTFKFLFLLSVFFSFRFLFSSLGYPFSFYISVLRFLFSFSLSIYFSHSIFSLLSVPGARFPFSLFLRFVPAQVWIFPFSRCRYHRICSSSREAPDNLNRTNRGACNRRRELNGHLAMLGNLRSSRKRSHSPFVENRPLIP